MHDKSSDKTFIYKQKGDAVNEAFKNVNKIEIIFHHNKNISSVKHRKTHKSEVTIIGNHTTDNYNHRNVRINETPG